MNTNRKRFIENCIIIVGLLIAIQYFYPPLGAIKLVEQCFPKYEISSDAYMSSKHDFLTFYHYTGYSKEGSFETSKGISGYVHDAGSTHTSFRIKHGENKSFQFSGEVIKSKPDWGSRLFDGEKRSLPILIYGNKKYVSLLPFLSITKKGWYAKLPRRCKY